ncbi:MAG TPA: ABC transporter substrate-binding protein, partial [Kiloniellales bacterium]|nr:ABC transporter substrate-binding protein [Kiloniellales bacterium]
TVNWEIDVVETHGLDEAEGLDLEVKQLASKGGTTISLQAEDVDMIVSDWVWVARQCAEGQAYSFVPYSTNLGALVVPADSAIESLDDLRGKRLGIAGGPLDKSFLLLRGLTERKHGFDAGQAVETVFAAPPLLNQQILQGRVDAVLNYWHYAARLEASGLRRLIGVEDIVRELGIESKVPLVGYVFDEDWAAANEADVLAFVRATRAARGILAESDAEWERLRPRMKAEDDATFRALRDGFRAGIPQRWGEAERADAERLFKILERLGGPKLVGDATTSTDGTFWLPASY